MRLIDLACACKSTVAVERRTDMVERPIVNEGIRGPSVESENFCGIRADPGDIADAAQVEDSERLFQRHGQSRMIKGREGSALAACRDIGRAKIRHDGDSG